MHLDSGPWLGCPNYRAFSIVLADGVAAMKAAQSFAINSLTD
jgi:hypothetical protein